MCRGGLQTFAGRRDEGRPGPEHGAARYVGYSGGRLVASERIPTRRPPEVTHCRCGSSHHLKVVEAVLLHPQKLQAPVKMRTLWYFDAL